MQSLISELLQKIEALDAQVEAELTRRRERIQFTMEDKKARFEQDLLEAHRRLRVGLYRFLVSSSVAAYLTAPVIYALIFPIALLDLFISVYQWICFPAYGIPKVRRAEYLVLDRHQLAYLNLIEKLNCVYCGYANGVIAYAREVASLTEQYWCPIKHARKVVAAHRRYYHFLEYGDAEGYRDKLEAIRDAVRSPGPLPERQGEEPDGSG